LAQQRNAIEAQLRETDMRLDAEMAERKRAEFDTLTGLPNRALFRDRLEQTLAQAQRNAWHVALMVVDIDQFKWINDTHGHTFGDELLKIVASRLSACGSPGDTVARIGGDEFAVGLPDLASAEAAGGGGGPKAPPPPPAAHKPAPQGVRQPR